MNQRIPVRIAVAGAMFFAGTVAADIVLFDITGGEGDAWIEFLDRHGYKPKGSYDLTAQFGDPGVVGIDGPVTLEGAAPKQVDSNLYPHGVGGRAGRGAGHTGLDLIGASAGFGNTETAILAGYFVDTFDILMNDEINGAAEVSATSFLGSDTVDITIYATDDVTMLGQFLALPATPRGHRYGIASDDGTPIGRINIYDVTGGAEGIVGRGTFYEVPAPGAIAPLGLIGVIKRRRSRR